MHSTSSPQCFIGLAQWKHPSWTDNLHAQATDAGELQSYAKAFTSIEGNHAFYGLPTPKQIEVWDRQTPSNFRFCFKLPKQISHQNALIDCEPLLNDFLDRLSLLSHKLGVVCLQLPESFDATQFDQLSAFVASLPQHINFSVELRHPDYFDKGPHEIALNRLLLEHNINRTLFDTRALFSSKATDEATLHAQQKKPHVPLHVIATGDAPVVRIITALDWQASMEQLAPWFPKLVQWCNEGKTPYVFLHTPNNTEAPLLAEHFCSVLKTKMPHQVGFLPWQKAHTQSGLF